ncbi:SacI homology domain-containing protein [Limtongia smithiae]|uniref:SacI homology domain-containing protein n=1 Tax=Limtongia smithiae TaxID=1125753 RepID=UPI0034D014A2
MDDPALYFAAMSEPLAASGDALSSPVIGYSVSEDHTVEQLKTEKDKDKPRDQQPPPPPPLPPLPSQPQPQQPQTQVQIPFLNFAASRPPPREPVPGFDFVKEEMHSGVPDRRSSTSLDNDSVSPIANGDPVPVESFNDAILNRMCKYTLYETKTRFYLIGSNINDTRFRVLKIDLNADQGDLVLNQDDTIYSHVEIIELLEAIQDGNPVGGLTKRLTSWGVIGFIRFTQYYYMSLITKRSAVALLGGHYIYHIDATELIPLCSSANYRKPHRNSGEARFLATFQNLDLSKTFYFSYSYDITHTLQRNLDRERARVKLNVSPSEWKVYSDYNEMFVWNQYLLKPAYAQNIDVLTWCLPVIHGFIDQANISVYGRNVSIAIIARRSHYFAGARYLKRGANDQGYVANDVETEQIVSDTLTTSFHALDGGLFANPSYTSFVQHRGSIPLFWTQDVSGMSPKPPIELNVVDPFFSAAALHFDDEFRRYGTPVAVFNLIKIRERTPRETILLHEFEQCIQYLNQFLPEEAKIFYTSWDMSHASKGRDQEVIEFLENYSDRILKTVKIFHNGPEPLSVQSGVCRTNCIDCLDRTNAAQFVIGKRALGYQLHALGIIKGTRVEYDTDAANLLTEMYHDHGDTIALQYGGSHLVNTMETYRRINQWTSHSRDLIESIRRYYNNSFVDSQRQEAINLFLGNYVFETGQPMLWDLSTDYYLHHGVPGNAKRPRRSYRKWWTPINVQEPLTQREIDDIRGEKVIKNGVKIVKSTSGYFDDYWMEYYKPRMLSSFSKVFHYNMNSTLRYLPSIATGNGKYNHSPFEPRQQHVEQHTAVRELTEKERMADDRSSIISAVSTRRSARRFLDIGFMDFSSKQLDNDRSMSPILDARSDTLLDEDGVSTLNHDNRATMPRSDDYYSQVASLSIDNDDGFNDTLWCYGGKKDERGAHEAYRGIDEIVDHMMKPGVTNSEAQEYKKYFSYPDLAPMSAAEKKAMAGTRQNMEFEKYIHGEGGPGSSVLSRGGAMNGRSISRNGADFGALSPSDEIVNAVDQVADEDSVLYVQHILAPEVATSLKLADDEQSKRFKLYQHWVKGKYSNGGN